MTISKKFKNNFFKKEFAALITMLLFSLIPVLEFLNNNGNNLQHILHENFYINLLFYLLAVCSFYYFGRLFFKNNFISYTFFFSFIILIQFQHRSFKFYLYNQLKDFNFFPNLASEFALIIILLIVILIFFLIKKKFFNFFLIFFLFFNFVFVSYKFIKIYKYNETTKFNKKTEDTKVTLATNKNKNIYFFILDSMKPLNEFKKFYNLKLNNYENFFKINNYTYHNNVKNNDTTEKSLTFLFNLDIKNNFTYYDNKKNLKFPRVLSGNNSLLIQKLNSLGYDFKWIGNVYADCSRYNYNLCLKGKKEKYFDIYLIKSFLENTAFLQIINTLNNTEVLSRFSNQKNLSTEILKLKKFLLDNPNEIKKKPNFFFVHHMHPHWPYKSDHKCNYKNFPGKTNFEGYKNSYLCVLKNIKDIIEVIEKIDKDSIVIFQSDHNWEMSVSPYNYGDRKSIFSLIKNNVKCDDKFLSNFNNVEIANYILNCLEKKNTN